MSYFSKETEKGIFNHLVRSDDESKGEIANKVMNFIRKYESGSESSDEDIPNEELVEVIEFCMKSVRKLAWLERNKRKL